MALDVKALVEFLEEVDRGLETSIRLVAVGGTALTLLDCKPSSQDVDFTGPGEDIRAFERSVARLSPGFKVDTWTDGQVFLVTLPQDYLGRSRPARRLPRLEIRCLHPVDLVVTKLGRYDDRDQEDIRTAIKKFKIRPADVNRRAAQALYAGNDKLFRQNLGHLLKQMGGQRAAARSRSR